MEEEKKPDPRDLDGDGKVTLEEKVKFVAAQATKKLNEVVAEAKDKIDNLTGKKE